MLLTRKKRPALLLFFVSLLCFGISAPSIAQDGHGPDRSDHHSSMEHTGHHGRWWDNPRLAQKIGLTEDQKSRMDAIFEQHKPQLTELNSTLKKDEGTLHPLLQADHLEEGKVLHQIDVIAQARANLEKSNARMLFDLRKVLTPEQWKKLQAMAREWREKHHDRRSNDWHHPSNEPQDGDNGQPASSPNQPKP